MVEVCPVEPISVAYDADGLPYLVSGAAPIVAYMSTERSIVAETPFCEEELRVLLRRQGLNLPAEEIPAFHQVYLHVLEMTALVRGSRGYTAEAALVFDPETAASR